MKKTIALQDLDCAHCAAKMECAINKIDGVTNGKVNFLTQKMTVDIDESNADEILSKIKAVCKKVEPDCILKI